MALPSKLSKLKMPKKNPALEKREEDLGQDLDNDLEEGEDSEHQDMVLGKEDKPEPGMGDEFGDLGDENGSIEASEDGSSMGHDLTEVADDDLIAELKKRGLAEDLESEDGNSAPAPESAPPSARSTSRY